MALIECTGNLFESKMQTLLITVNCVGAMGKGVALDCKKRYPECLQFYLDHYKFSYWSPFPYDIYLERTVRLLKTFDIEDGARKLLMFPTKKHWRNDSELEWIEDNLLTLADNYQKMGITSLAMPPLGCGNGGLSREQVFPLIRSVLKDLPIPIELYV